MSCADGSQLDSTLGEKGVHRFNPLLRRGDRRQRAGQRREYGPITIR
jgi:hypothetical protein